MKLKQVFFAVLLLAVAVAAPAYARGGHGGGHGFSSGHYGGGYRWVAPVVIGAGIGYVGARYYYAPAYYPPTYYAPPAPTVYVERPQTSVTSQQGCQRETREIFDKQGRSLGTQTFRVCPE